MVEGSAPSKTVAVPPCIRRARDGGALATPDSFTATVGTKKMTEKG
jgi:hypothetical protein